MTPFIRKYFTNETIISMRYGPKLWVHGKGTRFAINYRA